MEHSSATWIGVITLTIGVLTFILSEWDKRRRAILSSLKNWQSDTVAYIIDDHDDAGQTFDEIKARYLSAATQRKSGKVPSNMLQDEEIRRTLFDLLSKGVIHRMQNDRYLCIRQMDPEKAKIEAEEAIQKLSQYMLKNLREVTENVQEKQLAMSQHMSNQFEKFFHFMQEMRRDQDLSQQSEKIHRDIQRAALEIAGRDPCRYNVDQISIDVMDRTKADRVLVMIQIISLLQNGILTQDSDGKVSIRLFRVTDGVLSIKNES